jgi:hypothetical protein
MTVGRRLIVVNVPVGQPGTYLATLFSRARRKGKSGPPRRTYPVPVSNR